MATIKQLENQRIKEIQSLNENEVKSYIDNLVKQEFKALLNYNEGISYYVEKVDELNDLLGYKYNNLMNYVNKVRLDTSMDLFFYNEVNNIIIGTTEEYKKVLECISRLSDKLFGLEQLFKSIYNTYNEFKESEKIESIISGFGASVESVYVDCLNEFNTLKALIVNKIDNTDYECFINTMNTLKDDLSDNSFYGICGFEEKLSNFIKLLNCINHFKSKNHYHQVLDYYSEKLDESRNPLEYFSLIAYFKFEDSFPDEIPEDLFDEFMNNELKFDFKTCSFIYP